MKSGVEQSHWDCLLVKSCNSIYLKLSTIVFTVAFSRVKKYFHFGLLFSLLSAYSEKSTWSWQEGKVRVQGGVWWADTGCSCLLPITRSMAAPPLGGIREGGRGPVLGCLASQLHCSAAAHIALLLQNNKDSLCQWFKSNLMCGIKSLKAEIPFVRCLT